MIELLLLQQALAVRGATDVSSGNGAIRLQVWCHGPLLLVRAYDRTTHRPLSVLRRCHAQVSVMFRNLDEAVWRESAALAVAALAGEKGQVHALAELTLT